MFKMRKSISVCLVCTVFSVAFLFCKPAQAAPPGTGLRGADDDDIAKVTSVKITPTELRTNRIQLLKIDFKFTNPGRNLLGGRLMFPLHITPYTGKFPGIGNFRITSKKFIKKSAKYTHYISVLAEDWETMDVTVRFEDTKDRITPESEPVRLTHSKAGIAENQEEKQGIKKGRYAYDFTLFDQNGKKVTLSDYRGKVVLLDFCTMGCGSCRAEAQHMNELIKKFGENNFVPITVLVSDLSGMAPEKKALKQWAKEFNLETPVLGDNGVYDIYYWGNKVYSVNWTTTVPYNFIIDKDGKLFWKKKGYFQKKIERMINKALKK